MRENQFSTDESHRFARFSMTENSHVPTRKCWANAKICNGFSGSHEFNRLQNSMIISNSFCFNFHSMFAFNLDRMECNFFSALARLEFRNRIELKGRGRDHPPHNLIVHIPMHHCTDKSLRLIAHCLVNIQLLCCLLRMLCSCVLCWFECLPIENVHNNFSVRILPIWLIWRIAWGSYSFLSFFIRVGMRREIQWRCGPVHFYWTNDNIMHSTTSLSANEFSKFHSAWALSIGCLAFPQANSFVVLVL